LVGLLELGTAKARRDVVGNDAGGGLGEHSSLGDGRARDITQRVDASEPGREVGVIYRDPPVDGEPGPLDNLRYAVHRYSYEQVVRHALAACEAGLPNRLKSGICRVRKR
jgi:hypothetical protein